MTKRMLIAAGVAAVMAGPAAPSVSAAQAVTVRLQDRRPAARRPGAAAFGPGRGRRANPAAQRAVDPAKLSTVQEALDGIEIANADKMLQIAPDRYGNFIQRLRNLQIVRRRRQAQRLRLLNELRRVVNQQPSVDDAQLESRTRQLDEFDRQTAQDVQAAYEQIDEVLTPRQRARFRLFEEQMEQRKIEILTRVLRAGAAGRGVQ